MAITTFAPPGDALPVWVGPVCVLLGAASWLSAGATWRDGATAPEPAVMAAQVAPSASASPVPGPAVVAGAVAAVGSKAQRAASAQPPDKPCAPSVEYAFSSGAAAPRAVDEATLSAFKAWVDAHPDAGIVIEGYASVDGSSRSNLRLSHARARAVRQRLVNQGVNKKRFTLQAFGEYRPSLSAASPGDDRRAVARVVGVRTCAQGESP